jgi:formylglycine-generating enzyme required for sulfatase activity
MGKTVVTNAQYRRFVKASGYEGKADVDPDPDYDMYLRHWRGKSIMSDENDYPVVWVSWKNASAFCRWAGLALPSEAQWEFACRAGTTTAYYFGDDLKEFDKYGWANSSKEHHTHPVAGKLPNAWGLYDMAGNVWEWVEDGYLTYDHAWANSSKEHHPVAGKLPTGWKLYNMGGSIYATKYGPPPTDGSAWLKGKMTKVLKGGSWGNGPSVCGSSSRLNSAPTNASSEFGFRVVLPIREGG